MSLVFGMVRDMCLKRVLLDRYGYDLVTLRSMVSSATASFDDIYKLQDKGVCFETPGT